jgi:hypothetical protein
LSLAFNAIVFLIAAGPVLALANGPLPELFQMFVAAVGAVSVALWADSIDANHFMRALSGIRRIVVVAPLCILIQLIPLPLSLSHPIWKSAAEALSARGFGHITVDVGETLHALFVVISFTVLIFTTIAIARNRRRAELLLLGMSSITTLLALAVIFQNLAVTASNTSSSFLNSSLSLNSFGIVLSLAAIAVALERRETHRNAASGYIWIGLGGVAGFLINALAVTAVGGASSDIAVGFGVALLLLVFVVRLLNFGTWLTVTLCVLAFAGFTIMVAWLFEKNSGVPALLRFSQPLPPDVWAILQRMLDDNRWLGSGAGTFESIARLYQTEDATFAAPTTAVAISIELGWVGIIACFSIGISLLTKLFLGAIRRGRDSFFPAAAAACVLIAICGAFIGSGLLQSSVIMMIAIIVGLGLSQGISQTARQHS